LEDGEVAVDIEMGENAKRLEQKKSAAAAGIEGKLRLRDGRLLAFLERGEPSGQPLLYFHGIPGCRLDAWGGVGLAARTGVRLIGVDRPGFGNSDPSPGRKLLDWPDDVSQLVDALGIKRFAVVGFSGGGPYALACGYRMQERVSSVVIMAGLGPLDGPEGLGILGDVARMWRLVQRRPWVMTRMFALQGFFARHLPPMSHRISVGGLTPADLEVVERPEVAAGLLQAVREMTRQGGSGATQDMQVLLSAWGFRPDEVRVPVRVWQGGQDSMLRSSFGDSYGSLVADCTVTHCAEAGHFLLEDRMADVLGLAGMAATAPDGAAS
jgi:pimeloyl-ACP methyl ester carboxylesterase